MQAISDTTEKATPICWYVCWMPGCRIGLKPCATQRDSWRSPDVCMCVCVCAAQEIEFNKININCRVHGESERSFETARPRGSRSLNIQVHASVKKLFMGPTLRSVRFLPWETPEPRRDTGPEMIGGLEGPPRLIEEILSGRSAVVDPARRGTARRERMGDEKQAGDARLINNVGAIFIWQEEGSSSQR